MRLDRSDDRQACSLAGIRQACRLAPSLRLYYVAFLSLLSLYTYAQLLFILCLCSLGWARSALACCMAGHGGLLIGNHDLAGGAVRTRKK
jgi:hypothetical protein